jgi:hypothetical protein
VFFFAVDINLTDIDCHAPKAEGYGLCWLETVSLPLGPCLSCDAGFKVQGQFHADFQLLVRYAGYHAWDFGSVVESDYAYCVGRESLELRRRDIYDCVGEEFAFAREFCPFKLLAVAFVAERSGWQVDFSAFDAFARHKFLFVEELVELLNREWECAHAWLLL